MSWCKGLKVLEKKTFFYYNQLAWSEVIVINMIRCNIVSNVLVYSQISPNVRSPYGHGPQKYNTVAQSEAHSENSQSTRSLFT